MLLYIHYHGYSKTRVDSMPLNVAVSITIVSSPGYNTSIAGILEPDLQVVTMGQLRVVVE